MKSLLFAPLLLLNSFIGLTLCGEDFIPRKQSSVPGPALSPADAIAKMKVPEGFQVELVASEPDLQNPVAMAFDRRGRIWVTESFEYPRREPGPGRDRIKILEDTDQDGRIDSVKIFADGLNIPSGIALGYGGVWVGNAPDLLFLQDTDGDDRADVRRVVVTGFGRTDTHELPNAFTWSPEGHLVGLNGVFNFCRVAQEDRVYDFTCAMWRVHPITQHFDLFCEGTSNPWGIAHDKLGNAFISACVIDHLWHLTETGYYHRQAGPYPPYTWKIESIVDHAHQLAAYCGLHYYDSAAYPAHYRERLYMGNIHGGCLNVDRLDRKGSSYESHGEPDFLTANDVWFMPVAVQTGPDGCMYVLDWYDRYHCYQDANHDPQGVDRGHGRLYRIRYKDTPRAPAFDLNRESNESLVKRLADENSFFRDGARSVLAERSDPAIRPALQKLSLDNQASLRTRLCALWSLLSTHQPLDENYHQTLLANPEPALRMWGVRAAGNQSTVSPLLREQIAKLAEDNSRDVQLQVAIAATKIKDFPTTETLLRVATHCADDTLIAKIIWQNLHPRLPSHADALLASLKTPNWSTAPAFREIVPRSIQRLLDEPSGVEAAASITRAVIEQREPNLLSQCLYLIEQRIIAGELKDARRAALIAVLQPALKPYLNTPDAPGAPAAQRLLALWGDVQASESLWTALNTTKEVAQRGKLLEILARATPERLVSQAEPLLNSAKTPEEVAVVLQAFSAIEDPSLGTAVLNAYTSMPPVARPKAIELLTQRAPWSLQLLSHVAAEKVAKADIGAAALLRLAAQPNADVRKQIEAIYGTIRTERNPARQQVIDKIRTLTAQKSGDAASGRQVFAKVCGQCHKMHGEGQQVGPDITRNGRGNFEQMLSNVLDPNLVIGQGYQARTVLTVDGRVLTGLLVEDNEQRVVLNTQGGKQESIPRDQIESFKLSNLSLMPEGFETQLKDQELMDLFAYLSIETPPGQNPVTLIPGTPPKLNP